MSLSITNCFNMSVGVEPTERLVLDPTFSLNRKASILSLSTVSCHEYWRIILFLKEPD